MTHASTVPALVVRGPDSLPALVPHLVGFQPRSSLVLLGLAAERRVVRVTVRLDLPSPDADPDAVLDAWSVAVRALLRAEAHAAVLVVYPGDGESPWRGDEPGDLPHRDLLGGLADLLVAAGIACLDAVCVVGERIRSYWCLDLGCCPREGRDVDPAESLRVQAALVAHGSAPLASRDDLVHGLDERPPEDAVRRAVERAREGVVVRLPSGTSARIRRFVEDVRSWGAEPRNPATLARLVVLAQFLCGSVRSRDLLLRTLTLDPDRDLAGAARCVLGEAVRCASGRSAAPVASVLAVCAWVSGDGAAARVAVDRALSADPCYSLAGLVAAALDNGAPPWSWVSLMEEVSVAAILGDEPDDGERTAG